MKTRYRQTIERPILAGLAILASATAAADPQPAAAPARAGSADQGLRVFTCAHSFHAFVYNLLPEMAKEAGIRGHASAGRSSIGGSRVIQHWDVPDDKNETKAALRAGTVDVLTLSPIWIVPPADLRAVQPQPGDRREITWLPDEGIGKFARLGIEHNPGIRITVQEFWLPNDEYVPVYPLQTKKKVDHNATDLGRLRADQARYDKDVEDCVRHINASLGTTALCVVPVGAAAIALREKIVAGQAPGLRAQWDLFRDCWGHPLPPLQVLSAYCHFAVIYRRSPAGLPVPSALARMPDPSEAAKLNRLLQEIAWSAVASHPLTGCKAPTPDGLPRKDIP